MVLEDVIDHAHLDILWDRMVVDLDEILARGVVPHQFVYGNVQQDPPPFASYVFEDVLENRLVNQITRHLLGEGVYNKSYTGNTNVPNSELQPVHVDGGDLLAGLTEAQSAHKLVVNIPLKDVTEEDGSIELWPGTHQLMSNVLGDDIKVDPDTVERRRKSHPPVRGNTKKGSLLIRDNRVWHRGMPNHSSSPRFMIALIHCAAFIAPISKVSFSADLSSFFDTVDAVTDYVLTDEPIPYLDKHNPYDYPTQGHITPI